MRSLLNGGLKASLRTCLDALHVPIILDSRSFNEITLHRNFDGLDFLLRIAYKKQNKLFWYITVLLLLGYDWDYFME